MFSPAYSPLLRRSMQPSTLGNRKIADFSAVYQPISAASSAATATVSSSASTVKTDKEATEPSRPGGSQVIGSKQHWCADAGLSANFDCGFSVTRLLACPRKAHTPLAGRQHQRNYVAFKDGRGRRSIVIVPIGDSCPAQFTLQICRHVSSLNLILTAPFRDARCRMCGRIVDGHPEEVRNCWLLSSKISRAL